MNKESFIEKYFEESLTSEEVLLFNKLLNEDPAFKAAFEFEKTVKKAITLNERSELKKILQSFENSKKSILFNKWLYIAASFLIIITVLNWENITPKNYDTLYQNYYEIYPNTIAPTIRGDFSTYIESNAFYAYDNENYEEATKLFSAIYAKDHADFALIYQGISLMEVKKYKNASTVFSTHRYSEKNSLTPYFRWYAALNYLKLKDKKRAINHLEKLVENENPQREIAKKLLSDLK